MVVWMIEICISDIRQFLQIKNLQHSKSCWRLLAIASIYDVWCCWSEHFPPSPRRAESSDCLRASEMDEIAVCFLCVQHRVSLDFPKSKSLSKPDSISPWLLLLLHLTEPKLSHQLAASQPPPPHPPPPPALLPCSLDILMSFPCLDRGQYTWAGRGEGWGGGGFWIQSHDGWLLARGLIWPLWRLNPVNVLRKRRSDGEEAGQTNCESWTQRLTKRVE